MHAVWDVAGAEGYWLLYLTMVLPESQRFRFGVALGLSFWPLDSDVAAVPVLLTWASAADMGHAVLT